MCHACVTGAVQARMLSRRDLFRATPALAVTAAATAAVTAAAPRALAAGHERVVDMTHTVSPAFPTYFGAPGIAAEQKFNFAEHGFNLIELTVNEHTGTHIDAPLHFSADGASVDSIPVGQLVCPLCVIHIHEKAAEDREAQVTPDDLEAWIARNGPIPDNAVVAMHSGWEAHIGTDKYRGVEDGVQHFPGFHLEAAQMLIETTGAVCLAADTLSLDVGSSSTFDTHYAWLPTGRFGIENMANLAEVPEAGATLIVGAPKHEGGTGGPARLIALV
ncbi:MAG: cyclase family protein [Pseudomonadota bacterium]